MDIYNDGVLQESGATELDFIKNLGVSVSNGVATFSGYDDYYVKLTRSSSYSVPAKTWTTVTWTDVVYDPQNMWDENNPTYVTVPKDGIYIGSFTSYSTFANIYRTEAVIYKNSDSHLCGMSSWSPNPEWPYITGIFKLDANDKVYCKIRWANTGANQSYTNSVFVLVLWREL